MPLITREYEALVREKIRKHATLSRALDLVNQAQQCLETEGVSPEDLFPIKATLTRRINDYAERIETMAPSFEMLRLSGLVIEAREHGLCVFGPLGVLDYQGKWVEDTDTYSCKKDPSDPGLWNARLVAASS